MKKAVMYGAGNIGRGFIGQLFSLSGYKTCFVDINMTLIDRLISDGSYPHYTTVSDGYNKTIIENVTGIDGKDIGAVSEAISECELMATAVGVNVLKFIAKPLAAGLSLRYSKNGDPLNIIICENLVGADEYLRSLVYACLSPDEIKWADENVGFVEASIGRMVPAVPESLSSENPLSVCVEEFSMLPIDRDAIKGELPYLINVQPFSPFIFYIRRKLFLHNMSHAVTAYLGSLQGSRYIWESTGCPEIKLVSLMAIEESSLALSRAHGVDISLLLAHGQDLLFRFENKLLGDTVARVGRDTVRKLSSEDRLAGAVKLCLDNGVMPAAIMLGIAAALHFTGEDDKASAEVNAFVKENGVSSALEKYAGITDIKQVKIIEDFYARLKASEPLMKIITRLEELKRQ